MIIPPSNDFVVKTYNISTHNNVREITKREFYDTSLYSMLEFISFDNKDKTYVLKTLKRPLKHEIVVHKFVNEYSINGAKFLSGYTSEFYNLHFIIMEFVKDIQPVYNFEDSEQIGHYCELAQHLSYLHTNARGSIKKELKNIPEFNHNFYLNLLDKFSEKLPMLSKKINNELYLTHDIVEQFISSIEKIRISILKTTDLRRTLVHGDFDVGNIFFRPETKNGTLTRNNRKIMAIDWGLSHIDFPIVDIANLLHSLNLNPDDREKVLQSYFLISKGKFPKNFSLDNFETIGMILHHLFFIEFQLNTLETSSTNIDEYYEQIHHALENLIDLSNNIV